MKFKSTLLLALTAFLMIGLYSCKDNSTSPIDDYTNNQEMILEDLGAELDFVIQEGTIEKDIILQPLKSDFDLSMDGDDDKGKGSKDRDRDRDKDDECDGPKDRKTDFGKNDLRPDNRRNGRFGDNHKFGRIFLHRVFDKMDLTDEQLATILSAREDYVECIKTIRERLHSVLQPLFERARNARAGVLEDLRAGNITREEARAQIMAINKNLWDYIKEQGYFESAFEAMKKCREDFFAVIESTLTEEQLAIWEKYMEWLAKFECKPWKDKRPV